MLIIMLLRLSEFHRTILAKFERENNLLKKKLSNADTISSVRLAPCFILGLFKILCQQTLRQCSVNNTELCLSFAQVLSPFFLSLEKVLLIQIQKALKFERLKGKSKSSNL